MRYDISRDAIYIVFMKKLLKRVIVDGCTLGRDFIYGQGRYTLCLSTC